MRILTAGGGSGGHVTPVVAVLKEVKQLAPTADIRFWCDKKFEKQAKGIINNFDSSIRVDVIASGKMRRYHHLKWWQQLIKVKTIVAPNIIDMFKVFIGLVQSLVKMVIWRPDVVFAKGGFVCLPIGISARILKIPLVLHDSDAHPGLTNRILSRYASSIGTGAPLKFYNYPKDITHYVGVPVASEFKPFTDEQQRDSKTKLGFDADRPLVVVTGGGLGATRLNNATVVIGESLKLFTNTVLISGKTHFKDVSDMASKIVDDDKFRVISFVSDNMVELLGAADVVVARAGATTILELAGLAKPTILVPNGYLTGGHQLKNASVYAEANAVKVVDELELEQDPKILLQSIKQFIDDDVYAKKMGKNFNSFAKPNSAKDMAKLVLETVKH